MQKDDFFEQYNSFLEEAGISRNEIGIALGIIERFFDGFLNESHSSGTEGDSLSSGINQIPGQPDTTCYPLLVVLCDDRTDFYLRALQLLNHCVCCRNTTKAVVMATNYWNSGEFAKSCQEIFLYICETFKIPIYIVTSFIGKNISEFPVIRKGKKSK